MTWPEAFVAIARETAFPIMVVAVAWAVAWMHK